MSAVRESEKDRLIQLVTGEILDLAKDDFGRPDGHILWDRLSVGEGEADRRVSSHDSPSARCLFSLCEGTGTGLVLVNPKRGRRYARHFRGEGGGRQHRVAEHVDQTPIVDWLCRRFDHAGWPIGTEHPFTVDAGSHEQLRRSDYLVGLGKAAVPIAGEVQNRRTNHRQRAADARNAGYVSLWTPKHGDSLHGVAQLRFTNTFDEVAADRDPAQVQMAGFADLEWVDGKVTPTLRRIRMGEVAETLPGGGWVEFWVTRNQVLLVPPEHAARFAEHERRGEDDVRSGPADGIVRRHRQLLAQQAKEEAARRAAERQAEEMRRQRPAVERRIAAAQESPERLARFVAQGDPARLGGRLFWAVGRLADRSDVRNAAIPVVRAAIEAGMAVDDATRTVDRGLRAASRATSSPSSARTEPAVAEEAPQTPAAVVLDWSDSRHYTGRAEPCVLCKVPTSLRSDRGVPWHKACAEKWLTMNPGAAA